MVGAVGGARESILQPLAWADDVAIKDVTVAGGDYIYVCTSLSG